jgi:hypothetical protein
MSAKCAFLCNKLSVALSVGFPVDAAPDGTADPVAVRLTLLPREGPGVADVDAERSNRPLSDLARSWSNRQHFVCVLRAAGLPPPSDAS